MSEFVIVSIVILAIVALDAIGDGLRWIGKQVPHHVVEVVREAIWLSMVAHFMGNWIIIPVYYTARIALFDPLINLVAGKKISYIGSNSIYDKLLTWFTFKMKEPGTLIWVIRGMSLLSLTILILTK